MCSLCHFSLARIFLIGLLHLGLCGIASAHPVPDLPVRSYFNDDGSVEIRVEVDPRSFSSDPEALDYFIKSQVEAFDSPAVDEMHRTAEVLISQRLRFHFLPEGERKPVFQWEFRKLGDKPWDDSAAESVLVGSWRFKLGEAESYQLDALELDAFSVGVPMNVVFVNFLNRVQSERYAVLFPGESSFLLELSKGFGLDKTEADSGDWFSLFVSEVRRGFWHVIPKGFDHILFILGMFLLTRRWKPLLLQISAFTLAHTLTLWLASAGWITVSPKIVEPLIGASIVVVAIENIFHRNYTHWRLLIVFAFGLVHGLGFAGVMATRLDSTASLVVGLLGINIGVELGQICIVTLALILTARVSRNLDTYRKFVVIPVSILIALAGIWWVVERTLL